MSETIPRNSQLATACAKWAKISLTGLQPRRSLNLADKKADWKASLSALKRFSTSSDYQGPLPGDAHAALQSAWNWQSAGEQACQLLIYGIDLGLNGDVLRPVYVETVALWRDAAAVRQQVQQALSQETGQEFGMTPVISARGNEYRYAVILLTLATLLDAQDEVLAIVQDVLGFETDQLLDYLSAGGLQLEEVSEELFHKRPYGAMRPFFEQVIEALPDPLVPYLQNQYTEFFKLSPSRQKKGGQWQGTYYWALEVAALAVLYDWDDSGLRESTHYPADLVDYARNRIAQAEAASGNL